MLARTWHAVVRTIRREPVRIWLYGVAVALSAVAVARGWVGATDADLYLALFAVILGTEGLRTQTTSARYPQDGDGHRLVPQVGDEDGHYDAAGLVVTAAVALLVALAVWFVLVR